MQFLLVVIALFGCTLAADGWEKKCPKIYSDKVTRILVNYQSDPIIFNGQPIPGYYPLPPIAFNQSLDPNHGRYLAWGIDNETEVLANRERCLDKARDILGFNFRAGFRNETTGSYYLPEAIMAPSSRVAPPGAVLMFDQAGELGGVYSAREAVWNIEVQTDGVYGGLKGTAFLLNFATGQMVPGAFRKKGHTFSCGKYFFNAVDKDITNPDNIYTIYAEPFYASIMSTNEYGGQVLNAQVEFVDEYGVKGRLVESLSVTKNVSNTWLLNGQQVFNYFA